MQGSTEIKIFARPSGNLSFSYPCLKLFWTSFTVQSTVDHAMKTFSQARPSGKWLLKSASPTGKSTRLGQNFCRALCLPLEVTPVSSPDHWKKAPPSLPRLWEQTKISYGADRGLRTKRIKKNHAVPFCEVRVTQSYDLNTFFLHSPTSWRRPFEAGPSIGTSFPPKMNLDTPHPVRATKGIGSRHCANSKGHSSKRQ